MIVYGYRSSNRGAEAFQMTCSNCQCPQSVAVYFQKYAHICWIPIFPLSRYFSVVCPHCKYAMTDKEVKNQKPEMVYEIEAKNRSIPVWTFAGAMIIAIAVAIGFIQNERTKAQISEFKASPHAGDVVLVETNSQGKKLYQMMLIEDVNDASVQVKFGVSGYAPLSHAEEMAKAAGVPSAVDLQPEAMLLDRA